MLILYSLFQHSIMLMFKIVCRCYMVVVCFKSHTSSCCRSKLDVSVVVVVLTSYVIGVYMELCFRVYGQGQCLSVIGRYPHLHFPTY